MKEHRFARRATLVVLMISAAVAVIALAGTVLGPRTYKAAAQIALVPAKQLAAGDAQASWSELSGGQPVRAAAEVLNQTHWKLSAAAAGGVPPESMTVVASAVGGTNTVTITAETTSAQAAQVGLGKLVADATPLLGSVVGPYAVTVVQEAGPSD